LFSVILIAPFLLIIDENPKRFHKIPKRRKEAHFCSLSVEI
jgi:hypothetical protein